MTPTEFGDGFLVGLITGGMLTMAVVLAALAIKFAREGR